MTGAQKIYDPWVYIKETQFGKKPLIVGEAPGSAAPSSSWPSSAKSTKNLAALIFGSIANIDDLFENFELNNVYQNHPGMLHSRSQFDTRPAAEIVQTLAAFGVFSDRVTFFLGTRVNDAFAQSANFGPAFSSASKYDPASGWIDWVPVASRDEKLGLYLVVPHPSNWGDARYPLSSLEKLSALFRASIGLNPLVNFSAITFA